MSELNKLYNLEDRKIDVQRWKICPIDVKSQHDGTKYTITKDAANTLKDQIEHTPLYYGKSNYNLPRDHKGNDRRVIGTGLKGFIESDEYGTQWLTADYAVYTDANEDILENVKKFKDDISSSWELDQLLLDDNGNVYDAKYEGTAVMDSEYSAYRHHGLLVAEKTNGEGSESMDEESKALIKNLLDALKLQTTVNIKEQIEDKDEDIAQIENQIQWTADDIKWAKENETRVKDLEAELADKLSMIENLKSERQSLVDINNKFINM